MRRCRPRGMRAVRLVAAPKWIEGRGELTIFFDEKAGEESKIHFEEYVASHLAKRAIPGFVQVRSVFVCGACGGRRSAMCRPAGEEKKGRIGLAAMFAMSGFRSRDRRQRLEEPVESAVEAMDAVADEQRALNTAATVIEGKRAVGDFDVFISHNSLDKPAVRVLAARLRSRGLLPFVDEDDLPPGRPFQRELEARIIGMKAAAVVVGKSGMGPWHRLEQEALLQEFANSSRPVIPVILEDCEGKPALPLFLRGMTWVDFRQKEPEPFSRLVWGITGRKEG